MDVTKFVAFYLDITENINILIHLYTNVFLQSVFYNKQTTSLNKERDIVAIKITLGNSKFEHHDLKIFAMYDSLTQEILIYTGKLPVSEMKQRIKQILKLMTDNINQTDCQLLDEALNQADFYRDEVVEARDFSVQQLAPYTIY